MDVVELALPEISPVHKDPKDAKNIGRLGLAWLGLKLMNTVW